MACNITGALPARRVPAGTVIYRLYLSPVDQPPQQVEESGAEPVYPLVPCEFSIIVVQ